MTKKRPLKLIDCDDASDDTQDEATREARDPALLRQVESSKHSGFPVVDAARRLQGIITYAELRDGMAISGRGVDFIIASDVMRPFRPTIAPSADLNEAVEKMRGAGVRRLAVVDEDDPDKLLGILTNADVVSTLARLGASSPR